MKRITYILIFVFAIALTARAGGNDTIHTLRSAMEIYGYQPERALQIIDSALIVGNIDEVQAEQCRARIYGMTLMREQMDSLLGGPTDIRLDSAQAIATQLLTNESIKASLVRLRDVYEILAYTERKQNDIIGRAGQYACGFPPDRRRCARGYGSRTHSTLQRLAAANGGRAPA